MAYIIFKCQIFLLNPVPQETLFAWLLIVFSGRTTVETSIPCILLGADMQAEFLLWLKKVHVAKSIESINGPLP